MPKQRSSRKARGHFEAFAAVAVFIVILLAIYFASSDAGRIPTPENFSDTQVSAVPAHSAAPKPSSNDKDAMDVYILDVGQGDSIFLRSPSGKTMLVDASEPDEFEAINAFLQEQGVTRLDMVIATHPHSDHIGAMKKVIEAYDIGVFYMLDVEHTTSTYEKMIDALEKKSVKVRRAEANGETLLPWSDKVEVQVLSPLKNGSYDEDDLNDWSVVLRVSFAGSSILLTGDAEAYAETLMCEAFPPDTLRSTVIKAGHHGSSTSSSDVFLRAVQPQIAVISCGKNNDYGHPHKETLARYAKRGMDVYRTDLQGTLHLIFTADGVVVETEK